MWGHLIRLIRLVRPSKILVINTLSCAVAVAVGWHLVYFRDHPGLAWRAWGGLCRLVLELWRSGPGSP